ncbi:MAG: RluA family pseudouridine synthase [Gammaproteobacteria bacterium]|nr:RluA family pseudouridine synthase [Gammaproteobacteria bacterium]
MDPQNQKQSLGQSVSFLIIDESSDGQRIDNFLIKTLKGVPKSRIYRLLREGELRVNKKRVKPEYRLQVGDQLRVPPIRLSVSEVGVSQEAVSYLKDRVVFEDEALLVLNKPHGLAVHGGSGMHGGLIEALRVLRPDAKFLELVHRLDKETSGLILIAKTRPALKIMHEALRAHTITKIYHAIVVGSWPKRINKIEAALEKGHLKSGERRVWAKEDAKPSVTTFQVLKASPAFSLIEARPLTGRTHQIRVHCKVAGFPIWGDDKYGVVKQPGIAAPKRMYLHAAELKFTHPVSGESIHLKAPSGFELP